MYSFDARIRFSETDMDEILSIPGIIDYFQDAAIYHSMDVGNLVDVSERKHAWMICAWQIEIIEYPKHGDRVVVSTWPYSFKGFIGERNCTISDEKGRILVKANSIWSHVDLESGRPVKHPLELAQRYGGGEPLEMKNTTRKIAVPESGGERLDTIKVEKHHLDSIGHVNNGQYVKIALAQSLIKERTPAFRVEYKSQAHLGDLIIPVRYEEADREVITLLSQDEKIYATIEMAK